MPKTDAPSWWPFRSRTTAPDASQDPGPSSPSPRGTVEGRLKQLVLPSTVLHEPEKRFEGGWATASADICRAAVDSQRRHNEDTFSATEMSCFKALEWEYKHRDILPPAERLLPEGAGRQAYHDAMVRAYLSAMGMDAGEIDHALDSFKKGGTGNLHRRDGAAWATVTGAVSTIGSFIPDVSVKAVLAGVRVVLNAVTAKAQFDSGATRFRNAGTEKTHVVGEADAPPTAKSASSVLGTSSRLVGAALSGDMRIARDLSRLQGELAALEEAHARLEREDSPRHREAVRQATARLDKGFARFCHQAQLKDRYKAASENAKVEWRGNQRGLTVSYGVSALQLTATTLLIITPGLVAAPVSAGVSAAAAGVAALAYLGYQLSDGPSKDGEAKARRKIVALGKSMDVLAGQQAGQQRSRAQAYETYLEDRAAARRQLGGDARRHARDAAEDKLARSLRAIAARDVDGPELDMRRNWASYRDLDRRLQAVASDPLLDEHGKAAMAATAREEYAAAHAPEFDARAATSHWKTAMRLRLDAADRLLVGRFAKAHGDLLRFEDDAARRKLRRPGWRQAHQARRGALERAIVDDVVDLVNFRWAQSRMKPLGVPSDEPLPEGATARAAQALEAVRNPTLRDLFCGDGRAQVEALRAANELTLGERERYVYTNAGAALPGVLTANVYGAISDLGFSAGRAVEASHGVTTHHQFGDQGDGRFIGQTTASPTSHLTAGNRAPFKDRRLKPATAPIVAADEPQSLVLTLPPGDPDVLTRGDPAVAGSLQDMLQRLRTLDRVPERLVVRNADGSTAFEADLRATTPYVERQLDTSKPGDRIRYRLKQARIIGKEMATSVFGIFTQMAAQPVLRATRPAFDRGAREVAPEVRRQLRRPVPAPGLPDTPLGPDPEPPEAPADRAVTAAPMKASATEGPPDLGEVGTRPVRSGSSSPPDGPRQADVQARVGQASALEGGETRAARLKRLLENKITAQLDKQRESLAEGSRADASQALGPRVVQGGGRKSGRGGR